MTYLFTPPGLAALSDFIDATTLLAFDLDGTLAPIVADPAAIVIPDEIRQSLIQLNEMAPLAIITGRSRADALHHLGFPPRIIVGNHGAEGLPGQDARGEEFIRICQGWEKQLQSLLPTMAASGILMEEKGSTLSLHYRQSADPLVTKGQILGAILQLSPAPRRVSGKFVENLAPQGAANKGMALEVLMKHHHYPRAIFVGDDVTDEDVFRLRNPSIFGILVGENRMSAAGYYLKGEEEMARLLRYIMGQLLTKKTGQVQT